MEAFAERRAVLDNHVNATLDYAADIAAGKAAAPDLVIWPESSTDIDPYTDPTVFSDIQSAVDAVGAPVLVGALIGGPGPGQLQNDGIVWHPGTGPGQHYSKMHLVPFGEYIPFRDLIAKFVTRLDQIPIDMAPGHRPGLLTIGGVPVGDVICFEVAYDGLMRTVVQRGAGLVVVQTNNATYMGTGQVKQQFAISRLRAIETGRYVVVAATNGLSGILAPDGSVTERATPRTQAVLVGDVRLSSALTPAVRWGSALEQVLILLAAVSTSAGIGIGHRRRRLAHRRSGDNTGDHMGERHG
jgi:apolipoprotein N-acyltransferase